MFGFFGHRHEWEVIKSTFAPPVDTTLQTIPWDCLDKVERLLWGVTSYLLYCTVCGKLERKELLGSERPEWEVREAKQKLRREQEAQQKAFTDAIAPNV